MLRFAIILAAVAACCGAARTSATFHLYSTKDRSGRREELPTDGNFGGTNFDPGFTTIFLIHGHGGRQGDPFCRRIRDEILMYARDHNIIEVDWSEDAGLSFATASARVRLVAEDVETFIKGLTDTAVNSPAAELSQMHLVGFDLGAHLAGIASRELGSQTVRRITGLDPAGNSWSTNSLRLRDNDADYVEVIHTDTGLRGNGIGTTIGRVNFFANGGSNQPGCVTHSCSHNRAYELFAASISNHNLVGYPCNSMSSMNLNLCSSRGDSLKMGDLDLFKRGTTIYRINTRRSWPF